MWITKKLTAKEVPTKSSTATVLQPKHNDTAIASNEIRNAPLYAPYGISYIPKRGEQALLIPFEDGYICVGTLCEAKDIKEGELCLYSAGGAKIHLKANGDIILNGVRIDKYGNITALSLREGMTAE